MLERKLNKNSELEKRYQALEMRYQELAKYRDLFADPNAAFDHAKMGIYGQLITQFVTSLNEFQELPNFLKGEEIADFLRMDPDVSCRIIKMLNQNLRDQLLERAMSSFQWKSFFEPTFNALNGPNGYAIKVEGMRLNAEDDYKKLSELIDLWKKDQQLHTNVVSHQQKIEKIRSEIRFYIKEKIDRHGDHPQAIALRNVMIALFEDFGKIASDFKKDPTEDKIVSIKTLIKIMEDAQEDRAFKDLHRHPRNLTGFFRHIKKVDSVPVKMLKSLQEELTGLSADLTQWRDDEIKQSSPERNQHVTDLARRTCEQLTATNYRLPLSNEQEGDEVAQKVTNGKEEVEDEYRKQESGIEKQEEKIKKGKEKEVEIVDSLKKEDQGDGLDEIDLAPRLKM